MKLLAPDDPYSLLFKTLAGVAVKYILAPAIILVVVVAVVISYGQA